MVAPTRRARHWAAASKNERLAVGLISGTSVDAIEAVVCHVRGTGSTTALSLLSHVSVPFPRAVTKRILAVNDVRALCALNFELGERFAKAALHAIEVAGLKPKDIDVIGSHGQTVAHLRSALDAADRRGERHRRAHGHRRGERLSDP